MEALDVAGKVEFGVHPVRVTNSIYILVQLRVLIWFEIDAFLENIAFSEFLTFITINNVRFGGGEVVLFHQCLLDQVLDFFNGWCTVDAFLGEWTVWFCGAGLDTHCDDLFLRELSDLLCGLAVTLARLSEGFRDSGNDFVSLKRLNGTVTLSDLFDFHAHYVFG